MSMLTCCPVCATMFKVVPDQLRISQGWVRCGRCAEVFDATAHLQDRPAAGSGMSPGPRGLHTTDPLANPDKEAQERAARDEAETALLAEALAFAGRSPPSQLVDEGEGYPAFTLLRADDVDPVREGDSRLGQGLPEDGDSADPEAAAPPSTPVANPATDVRDDVRGDDLDDVDEVQPPTFVQEARRRDLWRRPGMRTALGIGLVSLATLLLVQYAVFDRDRLAVRAPALAGPIKALCRAAGCAVAAPRQIDAIVIDSSTFSKLRADGYRLSLTLKNNAANPVAMPAVELTLTDSQDQPVLRRVLMPADLGARSDVLAAASDWSGTLALTVLAGGSPARVSGYRVLAFYP